jgi:hypothetical protein
LCDKKLLRPKLSVGQYFLLFDVDDGDKEDEEKEEMGNICSAITVEEADPGLSSFFSSSTFVFFIGVVDEMEARAGSS